MRLLDNIQTSIYQIMQLIKTDNGLLNLLFYTTSDALEKPQIDRTLITDHIFISPVFDTTVSPYNKASHITLTIEKIITDSEEDLFDGTLRINVLCQLDIWPLNNNKIRPIEIINRIIDKVDNVKLATSHKLLFEGLELVVIDKNISGYSAIFSVIEGGGLENEF